MDKARLPEQQFVPEQVGKAGIASLGSKLSLREHLLAQTSLFLSGPHLLGCLPDCALYILCKKSYNSLQYVSTLIKAIRKKL